MYDLRNKIAAFLNVRKEVPFVELIDSAIVNMRLYLSKSKQIVDILYPIQGAMPTDAETEKATKEVALLEDLVNQMADFLDFLCEEGYITLQGDAAEMVLGKSEAKQGLACAFGSKISEKTFLNIFDKTILLLKQID